MRFDSITLFIMNFMNTTKNILRWVIALFIAILNKFVISIVIYNLQHIFNAFSMPIIFLRHFVSAFISLYLGFLIAPGTLKIKSIVFSTLNLILVVSIALNLYLAKAESARVFAALVECSSILFGLYVVIIFVRNKEKL